MTSNPRVWRWGALTIAGLLLLALPQLVRPYIIFVMYLIFLNISLAQSWNLVGGYTGLISLGHAAFFGTGAYASAILITKLNLPFLVAALGGGGLAALFSVIIAVPTFRFRGIYFAIGTLILAEALRIWMINWDLTGGAQGVHLPSANTPSLTTFYYLMLAVAAGATALVALILQSKLGVGLRAIRDSEEAAQNLGVSIFRTKLFAFILSAFIAGLTGGLHAVKLGTIEPYSIFSSAWTIDTVNTAIIGGIGTLIGPVVGAVFVTLLSENLSSLYTLHLIITGLILILVIRFLPAGLWGGLREMRWAKRLTARFGL